MADIAAADVTYTETAGSAHAVAGARSTGRQRLFKLTFGDGAKTYPVGGIPLTPSKLGCTAFVKRLRVLGTTVAAAGDNNPEYAWDGSETSPKLIAYGSDSAAAGATVPLAQLANAITLTQQNVLVEVEGW